MTVALSPASRDARIYRVNAWRDMKGRPALTFARYKADLSGWWQMEPFGKPTRDYLTRRKKWNWLAQKAAGWLREPHYVVGEVRTALRRSTTIPNTGSLRSMFPPPTKADYKAWGCPITKSTPRKRGAK